MRLLIKSLIFSIVLMLFVNVSGAQSGKLDSLFQKYKAEQVDSSRINRLNDIGWEFFALGKADSATWYANIALKESRRTEYLWGIMDAYGTLAVLALNSKNYSFSLSLHDTVFIYARRLLGDKNADQKILKNRISGTYYNVAMSYYGMTEFGKALEVGMKLIREAAEFGDSTHLILGNRLVGDLFFKRSNYGKSTRHFLTALRLARIRGDANNECDILNFLGIIMYDQKNYTKALEYWNAAAVIARKVKRFDVEAMVVGNSGNAYKDIGEYAKAIDHFNRGMELGGKLNLPGMVADNYSNLGHAYYLMKQYSFALQNYTKAMNIFRTLPMEINHAYIHLNLGELYTALRKYDQSRAHLDTALQISQSLGELNCRKEIYHALSNMYDSIGRSADAYRYYKLYSNIKDSLNSAEVLRIQAEMDMQSEFDKKELAIKEEQLRKEAESKAELESQALIRNILISGLGIVALFLIFMFKQNKKIIKARERAEQSEKFKQRFLANMSHEIRTPMNAVMGMTNILLEKKPTEEQKQYLDRIRKASDNLLVIINDILDLSKIEEGKMELEQVDFSIGDSLELVKQTLQFKAEEKGLALNIHCDNEVPKFLKGDPTRLNQILINLTGNAIKFTERGKVEISVIRNGADLSFSITDSGIGMTQEQLGKLFTAFQQAEAGTTRKYGGTGLGLTISKQLIELHGGRILVDSTPGIGTTFRFVIPCIEGSGAVTAAGESMITDSMLDSLKGIRVLLAEDNEYNRIVAVDILKIKIPGIIIDEANNGQEAVDFVQKHTYDVVLMDVQMPVMDGFDATQKIRQTHKDLPILAMTASVLRTDLEKCLSLGMNGYIPKPFKTHELLQGIYNAVKGGKLNRELPPEEEITEGDSVTNLTFLKEFCEGDRERMRKYINIYLKAVPGNIEKINSSLKNGDTETLKGTVHQQKAHFRMMGMKRAGKLAEEIEAECLTGVISEDVRSKISKLLLMVEESKTELSEV